jgi:biotin synthase-related radical SAM superfamily protein
MRTKNSSNDLPKLIRVSIGTGVVLGLMDGRLDAAPTTAYLMTYKRGRCTANCLFCPQAEKSYSRLDMLSRISWPRYPTLEVLERIRGSNRDHYTIKRICLQALNYSGVFDDLEPLIRTAKKLTNVPISVSCQPMYTQNVRRLAEAGADRIGVPLDAATEELFDRIKGASAGGPYRWTNQFELLKDAVNIFGKSRVSTHLIVGLGESEREMINTIQECTTLGVSPALFAFTPVPGTQLERGRQPSIEKYRRIQVARTLILKGVTTIKRMQFSRQGELVGFGVDEQTLEQVVRSGKPFLTSGCPDCNRPYYNEKPSGPIYNYPRSMTEREVFEVEAQLGLNEV